MTEQQDELQEIRSDIKEIKTLLLGNGKVGIIEMARSAYQHMNKVTATKNGLLDWVFRLLIAGAVGYTATVASILIKGA